MAEPYICSIGSTGYKPLQKRPLPCHRLVLSRVEIISAHSGDKILEESIVSDNKSKVFCIEYFSYIYISVREHVWRSEVESPCQLIYLSVTVT